MDYELETEGAYAYRKSLGFLDEADNLHFQRWLDREYDDRNDERDECQQAIYRLLGDDPALLSGRSWSELRGLAGL